MMSYCWQRAILWGCLVILAVGGSMAWAQDGALSEGVRAYFGFEETDRSIVGRCRPAQGRDTLDGYYYPTIDPDNDVIDTRRYDRYRVSGRFGSGLRFFREDGSYAEIPDFRLTHAELPDARLHEGIEALALSVWVKVESSHIGSLVSCKLDSGVEGFAWYIWGNRMRFQYGDGEAAHSADSSGISITDGQWRQLEVEFDAGEVRFYVDGVPAGQTTLEATRIAATDRPLRLGLYPTAQGIRGFDGVMDELVIADHRLAAQRWMAQVAVAHGEPVPEDAIAKEILFVECQPVTGNEQHFGESIFHTFYDKPVPLSFWMKGQPRRIKSAALVVYLPETVVLREVFASEHNLPYQLIDTKVSTVQRDGVRYYRHETTGHDIRANLERRNGLTITLALDARDSAVSAATVYWAVMINGEEVPGYDSNPFVVRFLSAEPVPQPRGRYMVIPYMMPSDTAFFDADLRDGIADIFLASGIRSTAYFYASDDPRRQSFDDHLLRRGIRHHEISLWYGPLRGSPTAEVPYAVNDKGEPGNRYLCPTQLFRSESFRRDYFDNVRGRLSRTRDGDWVMLDYEPWSVPGQFCYCDECRDAFAERFGLDETPTAATIKSSHRPQWARFWCEHGARATAMVADAVKAVNPTLVLCEYTYIYDYDDPELWRRYWSIPKDLRLHDDVVDNFMLSLYHINYRRAYDSVSQTMSVVNSDVSVIANLARANVMHGGYTTPQTSLSPQQIYQKAVMCASLGAQQFGLWPGKFIDGMYHVAMARARRLIESHEAFYFDGRRCDEDVSIDAADLSRDDYAYNVWENNGHRLLSLFNFTDEPVRLGITLGDWAGDVTTVVIGETHESLSVTDRLTVSVEPYGAHLLKFQP